MRRPEKTIAVLPFVNMSSNAENEYFSDGMTEEIINALAKIQGLKVTSRTSSFLFKDRKLSLPEIGKELNVSTILEGSVRLAGEQMRITAQLINVEDDFHFWSETFDRNLDDIFAVQDEISLLIADKLREHLGHFDIGDQLVEAQDIPVEVYKHYLRGRYFLMRLDLEGVLQGIAIMEEVTERQADFPLPYLGINQGYAYLGTMGLIPAHEGFMKSQPFLKKALELNENLPESQLNLSWIACWQNWDLEAAYRHLNKALALRPSDQIYLTISNTLAVEGKFEAALNYIDKALQLDPFSPMNRHFKGFIYHLQEKYEDAIAWYRQSLHVKADLGFPYRYWGEALLLMGRKEEALALFESPSPALKDKLNRLGGTTLTQAALGNTETCEEGIRELQTALDGPSMGLAMNFLIRTYTILGDHEQAMALIEKCVSIRFPSSLLFYTDPLLKPLRNSPRFQSLMQQMLGSSATYGFTERKYKQSLLDAEQLGAYKKSIEDLMEAEKPYLDPKLSLRDLAAMLGLPPNHLSRLLNEGFDKNFAEFVNAYRLESFKAKVADPKQRQMTILALAFDSGFNSKTVFNTFFKKAMGQTPRAYWKSVVG